MTARTWNTSGIGLFNDANNWTPAGVPVSGDSLTIQRGNAVEVLGQLTGLHIALSSSPQSDPSQTPPVPVLTLLDSTIAASTTITTQADTVLTGPGLATLQALGEVTNDGTVQVLSIGGRLAAQSSLSLNINDVSLGDSAVLQHGLFVNHGLLSVGYAATLDINGVGPSGVDPTAGLVNDGTITTTTLGEVRLDTNLTGTGKVDLNSVPAYYGPPGKSLYSGLFQVLADVQEVGAGQTFVFDGGNLELDNVATGKFLATLSGFGGSPGDTIALQDFHVTSSRFADGVLTLKNAGGTTEALHFAGSYKLSGFDITNETDGTVITAAAFAKSAGSFEVSATPEHPPYAGSLATLIDAVLSHPMDLLTHG